MAVFRLWRRRIDHQRALRNHERARGIAIGNDIAKAITEDRKRVIGRGRGCKRMWTWGYVQCENGIGLSIKCARNWGKRDQRRKRSSIIPNAPLRLDIRCNYHIFKRKRQIGTRKKGIIIE